MRVRILVAAAIVTGGGLAACSKPASQAGGSDARQIRLAEPPPLDSAVVSDLEAHQPSKPILVRRAGPLRAAPPSQAVRVAATVAEPQPQVMSLTTSSAAEALPVADLTPAPEAKAVGFGGQIGHGLGGFQLPANEPQNLGGGRGPMILIRGGMGGIDDKCDLRGGHRGGIAINRSTPFGSYPRGGIR